MPNWTSCKLEAPEEVLKKYTEIDEDGKPFFDFNLVIPRPEIYNDPELTSGFDTDWCIYWYLSNKGENARIIKTLFDFSFDDKTMNRCQEHSEEYYRRGQKYVQAFNQYGYKDWYDWSSDKWGTKWNACDSFFEDGCVTFQTAWCYPKPVINKIFKDNPDCYMVFTWEDEDYDGTNTLIHNKNGSIERYTEWRGEDEREVC